MIAALFLLMQSAAPPPSPGPLRAQARGSLAGLFRSGDYPAAAVQRGAEGSVQLRLEIGADGLVHGCSVIRSSGHVDLDQRSCEVVRERARYQPARDTRGRPTRDAHTAVISWRMSGTAPARLPFAAHRIVSSVTRLADGSESCWFEENGHRVAEQTGAGCTGLAPPASSPRDAEYRIVRTFSPEGHAAPAPETFGEEVGEAEAEVLVQPDGTLGSCRVMWQTGQLARADFCQHLQSTWNRLEPSLENGARRARVRVTFHVRLGARAR